MANVNRPPTAATDAAGVAAQASLWLNLMGSESDPDGDPLAVAMPGLGGTQGGAYTATAAVTVAGVDKAPVAVADSATTMTGTLVVVHLITNDTKVCPHDAPRPHAPGSPRKHIALGETETDRFSYMVSDGHGGTSATTAKVTVSGTWKPPTAAADTARADAQHAIAIDLLANDFDPQPDITPAVSSVVTSGIKGSGRSMRTVESIMPLVLRSRTATAARPELRSRSR